jgi:hypothetical protein
MVYQPSEPVEAGAPYLERLGNGYLVISCQSTFTDNSGRQRGKMEVVVGTPEGDRFAKQTAPFDSPGTNYWNSLLAVGDSSVIAATSSSGQRGSSIKLRKGNFLYFF